MKTRAYPSSQVQLPMFLNCQIFLKSSPGLKTVPSGMVMSAMYKLLLQASPRGAVAPTGGATGDASCVTPGSKDKVGSAPAPAVGEAPAVGSESVGTEIAVLVGSSVGDGA